MQNTFSKTKVRDTWTVPMCVTLAISPSSNLIEIWTMEVMEVKNWVECTMWSVAPLSRIQSVEAMWVVTTFEQKTKYSKGVDQIPKNLKTNGRLSNDVGNLVSVWSYFLWFLSTKVTMGVQQSNCWYSAWVRLTPWFELSSTTTGLLAKELACWPLDLNL